MVEPISLHVNGRFLTQPLSGMQRYATEMVATLDRIFLDTPELGRLVRPDILVPPGERRQPKWGAFPIRTVGKRKGHLWEQTDLAVAARDGVLLNLTSSGPLLHSRTILVLHDAAIFAHPEHFTYAYRSLHRFLRPRLARRARALATISEFSRRELAHWCKVPPDAFTVIGDSAEHMLDTRADRDILERHGLEPGRYALTVGNQSPNKNIALATRAFVAAGVRDWRLAVAGGGSDSIFGSGFVEDHPSLVFLGRVSDGELRALYENAGVFLFPSRYEGFGVPPLEAMILGCPVISSDVSAMPEVLGDAALYFRSNDADSLARAFQLLASDPNLRNRLGQAGRIRAARFSWTKSAHSMIELILSIAH